MDSQKHEMNEKRLIRWLIIATLVLVILVLGLQVRQLLRTSGQDDRSAPQGGEGLSAGEPGGASASTISAGKTAMIEDVRALNPDLAFDDLAALSAEELEQLCETGAPGLPIGRAAAAQAAEEYAGTLEVDSVTSKTDPELDESPAHYEVELQHVALGEFEYKVDAYTGAVLEGPANIMESAYVPAAGTPSPAGKSTAPASSKTPSETPQAPSAKQPAAAQPPAAEQPPAAQTPASGEALTGEEAAKAAAFAHAGIQEADASGVVVKTDWEDGVRVYEIEFRSGNTEYDYEIAASSGAILKSEQKWNGAGGAQAGSLIGEEAAKTAALTHAGVSAVSSIQWKLDEDDGGWVYEVEFWAGGVEYDYEIDAYTGAVRKAEQDR